MTELERWLRLLGGLVGAPLAYVVSVRPLDGLLAVLAMVVLVVGAVDLLVSGVLGYCPVYRYVAVPWARAERSGRPLSPSREDTAPGGGSEDRGAVQAAPKGRE